MFSTYKFTGKERDSESGLDMFGARYYGSSLGRFMTPDWAEKPIDVPYANDLLPIFRTKLSMICAKERGRQYVEEQVI